MTGLIGHWPLHEQSGRANDLSGNGNHGSVSGATQGVAGSGGLTAYSFDGSSAYIQTGAAWFPDSPVTASAWVYMEEDTADQSVLSHSNQRFYLGYSRFTNNFELRTYDGSNSQPLDSGITIVGEWVHLAATHDGSTQKIYVNGSEAANISANPVHTTDADMTTFGADGGGGGNPVRYFWTGNICDLRVYNRALSPTEITTLYEWGIGDYARPPTDGIARYALDGDVVDEWGSNDGTNNGVTFVDDAVRGQSGSLDSSNYIELNDPTSLEFQNFTLSAWIKPNYSSFPDSGANFLMMDDPVNGTGWKLGVINDGSVAYSIGDGGRQNYGTNSGVVADKAWSKVVLTYDGSELIVYCNGVRIESTSISTTLQYEDLGAEIGRNLTNDNNHLVGNIDDVRIYDYALSPHEVYELYRWGTRGRDMRADLVKV